MPGLDFIRRLRPVAYNLDATKAQTFGGREMPFYLAKACAERSKLRYTGFIAQEVEQAAKAAEYDFSGVKVPADSRTQTYGLRYAEFVVPLTKAIQELDAETSGDSSAMAARADATATKVMAEQRTALKRSEANLARLTEQLEQL